MRPIRVRLLASIHTQHEVRFIFTYLIKKGVSQKMGLEKILYPQNGLEFFNEIFITPWSKIE